VETQISACTCESSHFESIIGVVASSYPKGHQALDKDFLKWFYLDNPAGRATLIVAHERDFWIGLMVLIPVILESHCRSQRACFAVHGLTHPKHRGKKVFIKMIKCASDFLANQGVWLLGHPNAYALHAWKRQNVTFREPLRLFLAKFNLPFSSTRVHRISSLEQLRELPSRFWHALADKPDAHIKYTPEFIAWRFLDAPHREYFVSAVENRGVLLGLRVTRRFKGPFDLMVDYAASSSTLGGVLSSVRRPTLLVHSGFGSAAYELKKRCWKLPFKREIPFFLSTWDSRTDIDDMTGITLSASDFG
jgi:hypothetical protein